MKKNADLIKAMEALLFIYNLELNLRDTDKWVWKDIKKGIEVFANSIFAPLDNKKCNYVIEKQRLYIGPLQLTVGVKEIMNLYLLLDCLKQEVHLDLIHFTILQLRSETSVSRDDNHLEYYAGKSDTQNLYEVFRQDILSLIDNSDEITQKLVDQLFACINDYEKNFERIKRILRKLVNHHNIPKKKSAPAMRTVLMVIKYLKKRKNESLILNEMYNASFNSMKKGTNLDKYFKYSQLNTQVYTHISVAYKSIFAKKVFKFQQENIDKKINDIGGSVSIPTLAYDSWTSFQEILVSFFVEYCFASDQFKDIKLCQNEKCHKMILENRRNRRQFCSTKCRQAYFKKDPKNKCRDNQNKWIKEQFNSDNETIINFTNKQEELYSGEKILLDDCAGCKEIVSRGHCPNIIIKNPILIDIKPKRRKKIKLELDGLK